MGSDLAAMPSMPSYYPGRTGRGRFLDTDRMRSCLRSGALARNLVDYLTKSSCSAEWTRVVTDEKGAVFFMKRAEIEKQVRDNVKGYMDKFFN